MFFFYKCRSESGFWCFLLCMCTVKVLLAIISSSGTKNSVFPPQGTLTSEFMDKIMDKISLLDLLSGIPSYIYLFIISTAYCIIYDGVCLTLNFIFQPGETGGGV